MSSFLEKLHKGMVPGPDKKGVPEEENFEILESSDEVFSEQNATFAAYKSNAKTGAAKKTSGIPVLKESEPKIITSENIDEMAGETKSPAPKTKTRAVKKTTKKNMAKKKISPKEQEESEWLGNDGKLAVNVYQTDNDLVIQAAIAGIKASDLDVLIEDEMVTIRGTRPDPTAGEEGDYFIEECYWGDFGRKIILPVEVDAGRADATLKEGILIVRIPKIQREKKKKVTIKG